MDKFNYVNYVNYLWIFYCENITYPLKKLLRLIPLLCLHKIVCSTVEGLGKRMRLILEERKMEVKYGGGWIMSLIYPWPVARSDSSIALLSRILVLYVNANSAFYFCGPLDTSTEYNKLKKRFFKKNLLLVASRSNISHLDLLNYNS